MNTAEFAAAQFTRATGAGVDPHEYRRVTEDLTAVADWGPSFTRTGQAHLDRAERAGSSLSAGEHLLTAARWFHLATLAPYTEAHHAAAEADRALGRALAVLEPGARRVSGAGFTGWLPRLARPPHARAARKPRVNRFRRHDPVRSHPRLSGRAPTRFGSLLR